MPDTTDTTRTTPGSADLWTVDSSGMAARCLMGARVMSTAHTTSQGNKSLAPLASVLMEAVHEG